MEPRHFPRHALRSTDSNFGRREKEESAGLSKNAVIARDKEELTTRVSFSISKVTRIESICGAIR